MKNNLLSGSRGSAIHEPAGVGTQPQILSSEQSEKPVKERDYRAETTSAYAEPQTHPSGTSSRKQRTRLILLGTCGGPWVNRFRYASAQVIVVNEVPYLVDCGYGVLLQLERARIAYDSIRHVFITHHHSDHNADYGNLLVLSWGKSQGGMIDAWGPPPLEKMTKNALEYHDYDIRIRMEDEGKAPPDSSIQPHEITEPGLVMQDANVRVTAALVNHPPVEPAFAFRFDTPDRSIVVSGDTTPREELVELAREADVLVHEAMYLPAVFEQLEHAPVNVEKLEKHMLNSHTTAEDAGRIASEAGVKTLVLSHLIPADEAEFMVPDEVWIEQASNHFHGEIVVGDDLMEV